MIYSKLSENITRVHIVTTALGSTPDTNNLNSLQLETCSTSVKGPSLWKEHRRRCNSNLRGFYDIGRNCRITCETKQQTNCDHQA